VPVDETITAPMSDQELTVYLNNLITNNIERGQAYVFEQSVANPDFEQLLTIPILMFHDVDSADSNSATNGDDNFVNIAVFKEHLQYLYHNNFYSLSLLEYELIRQGAYVPPIDSILITFDDGINSYYHEVEPLLNEYSFKASSFLIGSTIDNNPYYLTSAQINDLIIYGHTDFASHTHNFHFQGEPGVTGLGSIETATKAEIINDSLNMNEVLGFDTKFMAYPYGHYGGNTTDALTETSIEYGFTSNDGISTITSDNYELPRLRVHPELTPAGLKLLLNKHNDPQLIVPTVPINEEIKSESLNLKRSPSFDPKLINSVSGRFGIIRTIV